MRRVILNTVVAAAALLHTGCALMAPTARNFQKIEVGMEESRVDKILGLPDSIQLIDGKFIGLYYNRYTDESLDTVATYYVIYEDGKVIMKGRGAEQNSQFWESFAVGVLAAGAVAADSYSRALSDTKQSYDPSTGNMYYTSKDPYGNTRVQGVNTTTGSQWNTTIKSNGDMSGYDADGNHWNYYNSSGWYYNWGTGKTCTGRGIYRMCY